MDGAFGIIFENEKLDTSLLKRIRMPDGKTCNVIALLTFLNLLRIGRVNFNMDNTGILQSFIHALKPLICDDNKFAATTLRNFGAVQMNVEIVLPRSIGVSYIPFLGNNASCFT